MNLEFERVEGSRIHLRLDEGLANLAKRNRLEALTRRARKRFGDRFGLEIGMVRRGDEANTPAVQREQRLREEREQAIEGLRADPEVSILINQFDAEIVPESVVPSNHRR